MALGILPSSELGLAGWIRKYNQRIVGMRENVGLLLLLQMGKKEAALIFFSCLSLSSKFLGNNFGQCTVSKRTRSQEKRDGFDGFPLEEAEKKLEWMEINRC